MKTSLIVPLYNEEARIGRTLPYMAAYATQRWGPQAEIIGVDDGSTDATTFRWAEAVATVRSRFPDTALCHIHLMQHSRNRGKGAAVRTGMLAAHGTTRVFLDADLSAPVTLWGEMDAILTRTDPPALVVGSRWMPGAHFVVPPPLYRQMMSRAFNVLLRWQTHLPYRDTQCGAKGFTAASARALFGTLRNDGFIFDVELLLRAQRTGLTVQEIPVEWTDQRGSTVHAWRDSWAMLWAARELVQVGEGG